MNETKESLEKRLAMFCNGLYHGLDLTIAFEHEISAFDSPWSWIRNRINHADYSGLIPGDYIPFTTTDGEYFEAQIAGIDTYYNTTDQEPGIGHHIDFITRDCRRETIPWNLEETNNGTVEHENPWLASHLHHHLNSTVWALLPDSLKNSIISKRMMIEKRYDSSALLSSSPLWQWNETGNLWVPNEFEVYGAIVWGSRGFSSPQAVQYPLFAGSWKNRIKGAGNGGERSYWWLNNPFDGDTSRICLVAIHGNASRNICTLQKARVPLCFRIGNQTA